MSRLLGDLLQKAQNIKSKVTEFRDELKERKVDAVSEDGLIKVVATCDKEIVSISIDPGCLTDGGKLQEALLKTVNDALDKAGEVQKEVGQRAMKEAGISLPGLF
ncbi:MAG: YbaB/EbfC family nucleoid-associated protein [Nitrospinota bacterium]|nr:YbaB/EbfC family nucleoid-associated protein [Nitrospinota bacterium]